MSVQKQKPSTIPVTELMKAFNFMPADLDANQHGYMTKEQRIKLRHGHRVLSWRGVIDFLPVLALCFVFATCFWAVMVRVLLSNANSPDQSSQMQNVLLLIILVITLIAAAIGQFSLNRKVERDLYKGFVSVICGTIHLDVPDDQKGKNPKGWYLSWQSFYSLEVNGIKFPINRRQWLVLLDIQHRPVCVYYAPNTMSILSIGE